MLVEKIKALYPQLTDSDFTETVVVQDDGKGPYIAKWGLDSPRPTDRQLAEVSEPARTDPKKNEPLALLVDFLKANPDVLDLVTKGIQSQGEKK